jgi:hypothetical protein
MATHHFPLGSPGSFQEKYQAFIDLAVRDFLSSCRSELGHFSMTKKLQETTVPRRAFLGVGDFSNPWPK